MTRILVVLFVIVTACAFTVGTFAPAPAAADKKKGEPDKAKKEADQKAKEAMKKAQEDKAKGGAVKGEKPKKDTKPLTPAEIGG